MQEGRSKGGRKRRRKKKRWQGGRGREKVEGRKGDWLIQLTDLEGSGGHGINHEWVLVKVVNHHHDQTIETKTEARARSTMVALLKTDLTQINLGVP